MIAAMARRRPVLLLLEDAHWIDPSTLEFLRLVQERLTGSRLLLLITARPEFKPGWSFPHVLQVNLDRLSRRDRVAMVERLTGGKSLPAAVLDQIIARTDGIPLFVEELTKTILDGGGLRDAGEHYELARADWTMAIPDTLHGSLLARLDRLDADAKGIAQVGAVIGREFRRDLLELVAGRGSEALDAALGRLLAAEIIVPAPASARIGGAFLFRHALIQEAAYQSLLLSRRARYHAAIADALERHFMDVVETQPEILAQHLTAASLPDRAIDYWLRAGKRSVSRAFFAEAVAQLRRGLHLVQQLPGGSAAQGPRSLPLLLILGRAQTETLGQIARKTFRDAVEIARQFRLPGAFAQAALSFEEGHRSLQSSQLDAVPLLEEALAGLGPDADDVDRCRVLSRLARALQNIGSFERATEINRLALPLAQRLNDARALHDASVCELLLHGVNPIRAAQFAQRQRRLDEFVAQGGTLGDFPLIVEALTYVLPFELEMGSYDRFYTALKRLETFTKASQSRLYPIVTATAQTMRLILLGDFAAAEQSADDAFQTGEGIAPGQWAGVYGMQMFTIRREQGRLAEVAPLLKRFVDENPENSAWRPGLMLIASDLGFERPARAALDEMAATKFNLPRDGKYPITMSYLAETCARLKDLPRAEMVYERLLPYRDLAIVVPATTLCCGAAARYLGLLAATLERWELAEEHFEAALVVNERLRAAPFLAHTQAEYADALLARGRDGDLGRAKELRAAATTTAERLGMAALLRRLGGQADTP